MADDLVSITDGLLSAAVAPMGAELRHLRDADGHELLWNGDPSFWTGRAPLLFPIVGALREDRYRLDGSTFSMPKHGFARRSAFVAVEQASDFAVLRLEADDATRAVYPFDFRLDVRFAMANGALTVTATVDNRGDTPMPASFGFHPALRWPLPYGEARADHRICFDQPEPAPVRRIDARGLVTPVRHPTPIDGRELVLDDALFVDDAIILDHPASRALTYGAGNGPFIEMRYPDMPMLGIWTKPGAGYICIEPWAGIADPEGFNDDLFAKPGIASIPPGGQSRYTMSVALRDEG